MQRREFLRAAATCAGLGLLGRSARAQSGRKPNIVFILIDDMGWMDIGCNGSDFYQTPNIDRLASQGMRFTDAYAACPVCSPTRASIMTGQYPARLHLTDFIAGKAAPHEKLLLPEWRKYLPNEVDTVAERLRAAGYRTACIGKWHLDSKGAAGVDHASTLPQAQGFDVAQDFPSQNIKNDDPKSIYAITRASLDFIDENKDRPFFLYMSHHTVHLAIEGREETVAKYAAKDTAGLRQKNPVYAAMVEHTDDSVGQVMAKLDSLGLTENTIVIFFSDNGGFSYVRGKSEAPTNNAPLRLGKGSLYEGAVRVPFIVRWPGKVAKGTVCNVPVISVDFYPTLAEIAGAPEAAGHVLDGVSLVPLLTISGKMPDRALYWHYPHYHHTAPGGMVREGDFKLIENFEDGSLELYNLSEDLGEQKNLASSMPEKAKELQAKLKSWREAVGAQMCSPNPNYDPAQAGTHLTEL